jgi:hypothetical protein
MTYDLFVSAANLSDATIIFDAWQAVETGSGAPSYIRATDHPIEIGPHQASTWTAQITTLSGRKRPVVLVSSVPNSTPQEAFPVTVIWHDWRVTKPR